MIDQPFVRRADWRDAPEVLAMCYELHRENGMFRMSERKVREYIEVALNRKGAVIGVIGEPGKRLQGSIYLLVSDHWYTDEWHLQELWSYVRPEFRKSNNAKELVNFSKRCSDEFHIPTVISIVSNDRTRAKIGLFQRMLGTAIGAVFVYNGNRTGTVPTPSPPATKAVSLAQRAVG